MHFRNSVLVLLFLLVAALPVLAETVNINKADMNALQQHLTGIGPVKAKAIINYRNKIGGFKSLDDLKQVPGIGDELFRKNRNALSLSSGVTQPETTGAKKTNSASSKSKPSTSKSSEGNKKELNNAEKKS